MSIDEDAALRSAEELAEKAVAVANELKPGTWDAVQALALASLATSMAVLAARDSRG